MPQLSEVIKTTDCTDYTDFFQQRISLILRIFLFNAASGNEGKRMLSVAIQFHSLPLAALGKYIFSPHGKLELFA